MPRPDPAASPEPRSTPPRAPARDLQGWGCLPASPAAKARAIFPRARSLMLLGVEALHRVVEGFSRQPQPRVHRVEIDPQRVADLRGGQLLHLGEHEDFALAVAQLFE